MQALLISGFTRNVRAYTHSGLVGRAFFEAHRIIYGLAAGKTADKTRCRQVKRQERYLADVKKLRKIEVQAFNCIKLQDEKLDTLHEQVVLQGRSVERSRQMLEILKRWARCVGIYIGAIEALQEEYVEYL